MISSLMYVGKGVTANIYGKIGNGRVIELVTGGIRDEYCCRSEDTWKCSWKDGLEKM